jgi:hypothetical protein
MVAAMTVSRTPAESTVLFLQRAAHSGSPVLIPGGWDVRPVRPASRPIGDAETRTTPIAQTVVVSDRETLEREREGGGAPGERARSHRASFLVRLWHGQQETSR